VHTARQSGFSLIELMITIAIMGVVLAFAVPNINDFFDKKRVIKLAEAIYSDLQYARTEAISAASNYEVSQAGGITVKFNRTDDTTWAIGTSVKPGCNTALIDPTADGACYVIKDDGDDIVDGVDVNLNNTLDTAEIDTGDRVIRVLRSTDHPGTKMTATPAFGTNVPTETTFNSSRGTTMDSATRTAESGQIDLESDGGFQLRVTVGVLGQIGICTPGGSVTGYTTCP
jgi:prepilin-type N-terminal cleavage/methylation domain-containing protein